MRTLIHGWICCGFILLAQWSTGQTAQAQETTRIAPPSGGVEFQEIHIVRWTALGAVKEADLTNMALSLWFAADWEPKVVGSLALIHLQSLSVVEDDAGHLLSTEKRLKQIHYLRGEVRENAWKGNDRKQGPIATLWLDAPGRGANRLKSVKGKAKVTLTKTVTLTFQDLASLDGKILEHPDMKSLADMKLRFSIVQEDGNLVAKLSAPVNYASPWKRGRLYDWDVMEGKYRIGLSSEGVFGDGEGVTVEKSYRRRTLKDLSLRLKVLAAVESKTFDFDFQNVELP